MSFASLAQPAVSPPVAVDARLLQKYGGQGPRYTSYPTADHFVEAFDASAQGYWLANRNIGGIRRPLSLYVHLPFSDSICCNCACNKAITHDPSRSARYVAYLRREMALVAARLPGDRAVAQVHWGGGTHAFLTDGELRALSDALRNGFELDPRGERAIEIDPGKTSAGRVALLAELGFNRMSLGVQDFNPEVRMAVHRVQGVEETVAVMEAARAHGFRSINMDLIYGLPGQTVEGFARTLEQLIACRPDRVALSSYARPSVFKPQGCLAEAELPRPEVKFLLLTLALTVLGNAGYDCIGLDHFARHDDDLAVAQREGRPRRSFQGYSSGGNCDIIGLGVSAISTLGPVYSQNTKDLEDYYAHLDQNALPVWRGIELAPDDLLRRAVIQSLACHFQVSKEAVSIAHLIDFDRYFAPELEQMKALEDDGLVTLDDDWITVTPAGRLVVRAACMIFDRYLRGERSRASYSRVE